MTREEAKKRLEVWQICGECPEDKQCYDSHLHSICEYDAYCDEVSISEAIKVAIKALSAESCEQIKWERDTAIAQLKELGYGLGEKPKAGWIPLKTRPMTEEETEHYFEYTDMRIDDTYTILDCPLPDDGQEVLVSWGGNVVNDVFIQDSEGCYFEGVDIDEVDAWMPLPEPYKAESEDKEYKCL